MGEVDSTTTSPIPQPWEVGVADDLLTLAGAGAVAGARDAAATVIVFHVDDLPLLTRVDGAHRKDSFWLREALENVVS